MLNIGFSPFTYGFGYNYAYYGYTNSSSVTFPALNVNYQIGLHEFISAGVLAGRFSRTYKSVYNHNGYTDEYKDSYSYTMFGVLAEVHIDNMLSALAVTDLNLGSQIDLYVGVNTGLFFSSWKSKDVWYSQEYNITTNQWYFVRNELSNSGSSVSSFLRSYLGGRYMFKNNFGAFLELGYASFGYMNLGVTFKM